MRKLSLRIMLSGGGKIVLFGGGDENHGTSVKTHKRPPAGGLGAYESNQIWVRLLRQTGDRVASGWTYNLPSLAQRP